MVHRGFLVALLACFTVPCWAGEFEDSSTLTDEVKIFLEASLASEYAGVQAENVKVAVSRLDPRLRLARCDQPLEQSITTPKPYRSNISVKVQCVGSKPWTIYVPATIDTYAEIAVITKSMGRGDIIGEGDIELKLMDTSQAGFGYIRDPERVIGMELKRRLQVGSAIRLTHLTAPDVVSKGEKVILEASAGGISVVTNGHALAAGQLGQQIRVRNSHSNREVDAVVVGPGRVKVAL